VDEQAKFLSPGNFLDLMNETHWFQTDLTELEIPPRASAMSVILFVVLGSFLQSMLEVRETFFLIADRS
jgi:hypothetical protein